LLPGRRGKVKEANRTFKRQKTTSVRLASGDIVLKVFEIESGSKGGGIILWTKKMGFGAKEGAEQERGCEKNGVLNHKETNRTRPAHCK